MDFSKDVKDLHRDSMAKVNASLSVSGVMTERRDARRQRVKSELSLVTGPRLSRISRVFYSRENLCSIFTVAACKNNVVRLTSAWDSST